MADYLLFLLFTGLRRQEAATLKWSAIDLNDRSFTLTDTKNHQPLTLPLTDFIYDLLENRKTVTNSEYVFAGDGKSGYLIEPRRQVQKVIQSSGVYRSHCMTCAAPSSPLPKVSTYLLMR
ncbi:tyrosine-type recombinase/integrase [Nitrosomonas sp. Nm166]|uniref:tyrosine-type recombinase/integrase n=1 Tax=Nitrosomonas sp. Nm166 TaxID=1881054 RepID=UPI0008ED25B1|nr:tyrosine-type recombinase/integrase [Nitrosomonas sp. Nm166]SFF21636.1 Phage integrase family protein [Nitrosomonas sp. Nm166]